MKFVNRNNVQQIQRNKELIELHYETDRVVASYGITIIGQLETWPDPEPSVPNSFGDTYLVGAEPPYDFYIWTRTSADTPIEEGIWVNIGTISIKGDKGDTGNGIQKIQRVGDDMVITYTDGQKYNFGNLRGNPGAPGKDGVSPIIRTTAAENGVRITVTNADGTIYSAFIQNGKDGISIKGDKGDPGAFTFKGALSDINQLPDAEDMAPGDAYLVTTAKGYDIWVVAGTAPANYEWINAGPVSGGSIVKVNGVPVNEFDADTKLDKWKNSYESMLFWNPTSKKYEDKRLATWYGTAFENAIPLYYKQDLPQADVSRNYGTLITNTPMYAYQATNKLYVDNSIRTAIDNARTYLHTITLYGPGMFGSPMVLSAPSVDTSEATDYHSLPWGGGTVLPVLGPIGSQFCTIKFNTSDLADAEISWENTDHLQFDSFTDHYTLDDIDNPIYIVDEVIS